MNAKYHVVTKCFIWTVHVFSGFVKQQKIVWHGWASGKPNRLFTIY